MSIAQTTNHDTKTTSATGETQVLVPFDSQTALRALTNSAAVRFASIGQACYRLEKAGRATFNDFVDGANDSLVDSDGLDGSIEMSLHERAQIYGGIYEVLNGLAADRAETKYDLPMSLRDAYSFIVYGQTLPTDGDIARFKATALANAMLKAKCYEP